MPSDQARISARTPHRDFACAECSSPLIQPLEWERLSVETWRVLVRCPECYRLGVLHITQEQAAHFRNLLDDAVHSMEESAELLDHQVFEESCRHFARALREGHICPMDF